VIEQAARGGHDHVHAVAQGVRLGVGANPAVDGHAGQRGVVREALEIVLDLDGEFAGGCEHQDPRSLDGRRAFFHAVARRLAPLEQSLQDRQQEGQRLAGARLRARDYVPSGENEGEHRALHGRRPLERAVGDTLEEARVERQRRERDRRRVVRGRVERQVESKLP
jgi:hypothetical protein